MFSLRIHSVDTNHLLTLSISDHNTAFENPNPKIQECRGIVHLYRHLSSSPPNPSSTLLFILAVPSHLSSDDFLRFCASHIDSVSEILLIRNDAMEDRYSVLIKLIDQERAHTFYRHLNGRPFSFSKAEVCHILFTASVEYTEVTEIAGTPPPGCTELPTCPVCLERLDQDTSGILTTLCDHSFQCLCISKWTHSFCSVCQFCQQQAEKPTCSVCGTLESLWICVICGFIGCGRYKERHAIQHWKDSQHCYSLDLETHRVWDYDGATYVHRLNQSKADGKLVELSFDCRSLDGDCGTSNYNEESGISGTLLSSKIETVRQFCQQVHQFCQQQAEKPTCSVCGTLESLWICVICGFIGCGRYKERHAIQHWKDTQHCYSLDLETQRVWDYDGDTYVHRLNQSKADGKLVELSFDCRSLDGDCGTYNYNGESGISGTLLSSKIETVRQFCQQVRQFCQQQAEKPTCSVCGTLESLWICVICGFIGCGRYKERHAIQHWKDTQHCYSLDLETQRVWDYDGDTYVHRLNQSKADGKLVELSFDCRSLDGDCGTYNYNGESGISGTLLSSKIETVRQFCQQQTEKPTCSVCGTLESLWICVICGFIGCGRYKERHAIQHWKDTQHCYSLDLETQRVWNYDGDTYVHRLNQSKADGKLVELSFDCRSLDGDCGTYNYNGESGISGTLLSSKIETVREFCQQQAEKPTCSVCGTLESLWICIICGFIGCGRYKERHAIQHWKDTQHCYSLDLETHRVWDYDGDTYVHRLNQSKADGKLVELSFDCRSLDGDCGTYNYNEESGISGTLLSSKIETVCEFCQQQAEKPTCSVCGTLESLWICIICGFIGCGRYKERHAIQHWKDTQHCYSLDLETQRVWDYDGDTYVHRLNQSKADGKLVELSFDCRSLNGDCGTYNYNEESGISGTLLSSKIETIVDEYNHLLMSQLESQRQYYEKLLAEAKGSKQKPIAEAVDKALNSKVQKIQFSIEKCVEENKIVASINESLVKDQKNGKLKVKEIEERRKAALRFKDEKIRDLEEQIRDLTVYIEAQKTLEKMTDADEIRGGTVLPVSSEPSTSGNNNKRRTKINRRRT